MASGLKDHFQNSFCIYSFSRHIVFQLHVHFSGIWVFSHKIKCGFFNLGHWVRWKNFSVWDFWVSILQPELGWNKAFMRRGWNFEGKMFSYVCVRKNRRRKREINNRIQKPPWCFYHGPVVLKRGRLLKLPVVKCVNNIRMYRLMIYHVAAGRYIIYTQITFYSFIENFNYLLSECIWGCKVIREVRGPFIIECSLLALLHGINIIRVKSRERVYLP